MKHMKLICGRFSPFDAEDEVVVPEAVEGGDGLLRIALVVVVDEGEPLALTSDLVLGDEVNWKKCIKFDIFPHPFSSLF